MNKFLFLLSLFIVPAASAQKYAKLMDSDLCKTKINEKAKSTSSIQSNFTEVIHSSMYNSVKKANGTLNYKKDDKIRWEHTSPNKQIVLINGKNVRLQENGKEIKSAGANQIVKKVQSLMLQLFSGKFLNETEFTIAYYENSANYKLVLKPKSTRMSKYIAEIEMILNKKTLALVELTLAESESDKIVYTFNTPVFNGQIQDSTFTTF